MGKNIMFVSGYEWKKKHKHLKIHGSKNSLYCNSLKKIVKWWMKLEWKIIFTSTATSAI